MTHTFEERLIDQATCALEVFGLYLGDRLGLYRALRDGGAATPGELARQCAIHPRYAREWLEQQAVAGVLTVEDAEAPAEQRRYRLPQAHVAALTDAEHPNHLAPLARMIAGIGGALEEVVAAYRSGGGVAYARYGADFRHGQGGINRPAFSRDLVTSWLPALGDTAERLRTGGRVADLGCGQGWSAIAVARQYAGAEVVGVDCDPGSIEDARANAAQAGVAVRFECADAAALSSHGPFDVVMLLEVLHDLARPVSALAAAREALARGGAVLVADECVAPHFHAPGDALERMMYGWSITHCLPTQLVEQPSAAIGTVIRESTLRELASQAGFGSTRVLDVDGGFFRLYELRA
ncbi:MAG TPA: methyltransferase domain-containing protein [Candidatus Binatia bacterium]|nr:methyltransferase domain-containing protein [Candidatus Binatia bacterium]